jgi:hypothetical protein
VALPAQERTPATEKVRCSFDYGPAQMCVMTDVVSGGVHRMRFTAGKRQATFVGKANTGWWAGRLNGRPGMGYERNRGYTAFSSYDLSTSFAWWYPGSEHGSY